MKTGGLVVWQRPGFADGTIRERPRIGQRRSEASNNLLEVLAPHLLALHGHDEKDQPTDVVYLRKVVFKVIW